jgi:signal transduction histidine kinase
MKIRRSEIALLLQAAAIVLPVAALSGIALHFLREDKAAIEREARDKAQAEMPERVRALRQQVQSLVQHAVAAQIQDGQAFIPGDYPRQPEPTAASTEATAALRRLEAAEKRGEPDLIPEAVSVANRFPHGVTESGTPVSDLALLLALRHVKDGILMPDLLDGLRRNVLDFPSFLAPEILSVAKQVATSRSAARLAPIDEAWTQSEARREKLRAKMRTVAARLVGSSGPTAIRVAELDPAWLALCQPAPGGWNAILTADLTMGRAISYTGVTIEIDQERWRAGAVNSSPTVLASAGGLLDVPAGHRFSTSVDLADPELLFATYTKRRKLTEALILCAAGTALIGLATLWTGYRRQARLSEMKSNFVSSVSHELRTPLAAVRLMAESLDGGRVVDEGKQKEYYRLIVQECRRLSALVENVLDLSRIGDGRKRYSFEPVDVTALVRQSIALMEPCAAERQVSIRLADQGAGELRPVWDGQAVEQSLVNLLDNAIKHSPVGAVVQVAVERDAGNVRLWVEDHGPGIPVGEQKRIFELFYRHGSELRRETTGAGIGLSIVRHVAEAHGGRVIVDSEVGRGSRFGLELPAEHRS